MKEEYPVRFHFHDSNHIFAGLLSLLAGIAVLLFYSKYNSSFLISTSFFLCILFVIDKKKYISMIKIPKIIQTVQISIIIQTDDEIVEVVTIYIGSKMNFLLYEQ